MKNEKFGEEVVLTDDQRLVVKRMFDRGTQLRHAAVMMAEEATEYRGEIWNTLARNGLIDKKNRYQWFDGRLFCLGLEFGLDEVKDQIRRENEK